MATVILSSGLTFLSVCVVGILGWAFNIQSTVSVQTQRVDDLKELINSRFDTVDMRLKRIETSMNGKLHG